jgi:lipoprotein-anchoring transpeptidase ErfK/SrfK
MRLLLAASALALLPASAFCQTMVESAILSGAVASAASGSAAATGSALSKSLGNIDSTLARAAGASAPATALVRPAPTRATPPLPKPLQAAFQGVEPGTARADVIAKAGKPQFAIASSEEELLRYTTREGGSIRIRVVEGKVSSIEQTPPKTTPIPPPTPPVDPVK